MKIIPRRSNAGLRAHHLTADFRQKSYLLAVRRFDPGNAVDRERAGELVTLWAGQVLQEYGLDWSVVAGAVADMGAEARFAGFPRRISGILCEGCTVYKLDRAMVDAFGLQRCPGGAKKRAARDMVMGAKSFIDRVKDFDTAEVYTLKVLKNNQTTV